MVTLFWTDCGLNSAALPNKPSLISTHVVFAHLVFGLAAAKDVSWPFREFEFKFKCKNFIASSACAGFNKDAKFYMWFSSMIPKHD